ncbi:MAG: hypothetical protein AUG51_15305 [Acidobacteria bacterium 13_1_20CM_3_53_8]|nr:MAG: hypothetical protein AUG51_15305 [Acidobacteria bacterium 13_1_20CM_3_53_8]
MFAISRKDSNRRKEANELRFYRRNLRACSLLLLIFVFSCQSNRTSQPRNTHRGVGVVVRVEPQKKIIELNHEEIPNYMPAMQMEYHVRDATQLESLKAGDKVEFTLEENNGVEMITAIKKL